MSFQMGGNFRLSEIAAALATLCRDRGYLTAKVTARTEAARGPDQLRLVFDVEAGPQAKVAESHVEGAPEGEATQVLARLGAAAGAKFDQAALDLAVERYGADLRAHGLSDEEILDVVLASSARSFFTKTLDALGAVPDDAFRELEPEILEAFTQGRQFP